MKKIIKILFLTNFLAVTLISAFLYIQFTMNKATVSMYSIKDHYTYVRIKAPIENKDKLFVNLEKIKDISKKNKVNILFRNYDNPISYAADNKIDFGRSEYLINDFSYNVNSKSYIQTLYKDGRIRHTDRDQKFELNEFDEIKPNMNGIFLIETKNKKIIKKIYLELENKKIPLYEKNGSTFKYPDPELKTYKIFYDFYGFIILFLLITLCLLVFSFNKSIRIYKSMGYTNTQINYSILGKYLLLTTLVSLIIIYPLSKNNRLQIVNMELGFLILFYILSYFVAFISTLNTNNINIATAIKKKSLQNGTLISVKLIVSFIFIMMSFPIVNNALYAFNLNIERTSNYSKKTLVFFPVHMGQFITSTINPGNQFDYVTNNILKIAESIDGEAMHVMNPRSMGPNQIIMMNENTFKKQNLRDYLGEKIEYFDTGKVRLFIPYTLRKNTDSIKKMVLDDSSIPTNIEYIDDKQTLNYNGETKKYYDPVILVASSKQLYDKKYKLAIALAPNGGGKKDYMNIPGKSSYYKNIEKELDEKGLKSTFPSLVRLSDVPSIESKSIIGNILIYRFEMMMTLTLIVLMSVVSYSLLIFSKSKKRAISILFGKNEKSGYIKLLSISVLQTILLVLMSRYTLNMSAGILISIAFLFALDFVIIYILFKNNINKSIRSLFSEV